MRVPSQERRTTFHRVCHSGRASARGLSTGSFGDQGRLFSSKPPLRMIFTHVSADRSRQVALPDLFPACLGSSVVFQRRTDQRITRRSRHELAVSQLSIYRRSSAEHCAAPSSLPLCGDLSVGESFGPACTRSVFDCPTAMVRSGRSFRRCDSESDVSGATRAGDVVLLSQRSTAGG